MSHLLFPLAQHALSVMEECLLGAGLERSVEGWVADSGQRAGRSALAFEEGEGEDEEANTHDAQDDHT